MPEAKAAGARAAEAREQEAPERKANDVDSTRLSWLAETTDGARDKDLVLVVDENGLLQVKKSERRDPKKDSLPIRAEWEGGKKQELRVKTKSAKPNRKKVREVVITVEPDLPTDPPIQTPPLKYADDWDAVFWTESAVEKFLYPYYRSQRLWDDKMDKLERSFREKERAYAIAHKAPSHSGDLVLPAERTLTIGGIVDGEAKWMDLVEFLEFLQKLKS